MRGYSVGGWKLIIMNINIWHYLRNVILSLLRRVSDSEHGDSLSIRTTVQVRCLRRLPAANALRKHTWGDGRGGNWARFSVRACVRA